MGNCTITIVDQPGQQQQGGQKPAPQQGHGQAAGGASAAAPVAAPAKAAAPAGAPAAAAAVGTSSAGLAGRVYIVSHHNKKLTCDAKNQLSVGDAFGDNATWTISDTGTGRYFVTSHSGQQLGCGSDGKLYLSTNKAAWEQWVINTHGDKVIFTSAHGTTFSNADAAGHFALYCQSKNTAGWEQWQLQKLPAPEVKVAGGSSSGGLAGRVYIVSAHNKKITVDEKGNLSAGDGFGPHATWTLADTGAARYFVTSHAGQQLGCSPEGKLYLSNNKAAWEQWNITTHGDKVIFTSAHGTTLSNADAAGHFAVYCQSKNTAGWEQWKLQKA